MISELSGCEQLPEDRLANDNSWIAPLWVYERNGLNPIARMWHFTSTHSERVRLKVQDSVHLIDNKTYHAECYWTGIMKQVYSALLSMITALPKSEITLTSQDRCQRKKSPNKEYGTKKNTNDDRVLYIFSLKPTLAIDNPESLCHAWASAW